MNIKLNTQSRVFSAKRTQAPAASDAPKAACCSGGPSDSAQISTQSSGVNIAALLAEFGGRPHWISPVCRTLAANDAPHDFINVVVSFESTRSPLAVKVACRQIEAKLGRVRPSIYCAADIDILAHWEQPRPTHAQQFVQESYLLPLVDNLLLGLGLQCLSEIPPCTDMVSLQLEGGLMIGLETLELGR